MKKKYKILFITFISLIILFGVGITYSIFTSGSDLNSSEQNIAKFIFNSDLTDEINLSLVGFNPGDSKEYPFYVTNKIGDIKSDVTVEYQIILKTYHFIPLKIELYKVNSTDELIMNCDETYTRNEDNELVCNSGVIELKYDSSGVDSYKLKIEFPDTYSGEEYSDLVDYINIEINSWQKLDK